MGLADRLKDNERRKRADRTPEEALRDTFNETSTILINQFMAQVQAGTVQITDIADMTRLFQIYMQVNRMDERMGEGTGSLPALSAGQKDIIAQSLETEKVDKNGEEEEIVSLVDLAAMDDETLNKMLAEKEIQMNKENEATF